ncbi:IS1182 family transposase [Lactobacillaceae bacterium Scapto_B20]
MMKSYNMNQTSLKLSTEWKPKDNNPVVIINKIVEGLKINSTYTFGRPRDYDLRSLLKLVLFAYTKGIFSSRRISELAEDSLSARWLTQEQVPSYRTICRFRVSNETEQLINQCLVNLTQYLKTNKMIDEVTFIDGTKILADANKYSFVWKKNTIRFDKLNREAIISLLKELNEAKYNCEIPDDTDISLETLDEIIIKLENNLEDLNRSIENENNISPNPSKKKRRKLKAIKRKLQFRKHKHSEYQEQSKLYNNRNSFSKTDHDATFMRVKEDPMLNGQLKPAYNLQIATSNQFITGFSIYQNPTDTRTLPSFLIKQSTFGTLGKYIVADAGYGSESNYRFIEDKLTNHISIIPYSTMLKENSKKWKSDDRKVMNWDYHDKDDYFIDPKGTRFNFHTYRNRTDKYGFKRDFKEYLAEKYDENNVLKPSALTKRGYVRRINVNESWEYFKAKQRDLLSNSETASIYARRKIDVESVFGRLKAYLRFNRFSVRGLNRVKKEAGIVIMAMNIRKLVAQATNKLLFKTKIGLETKFMIFVSRPIIFGGLCHSPYFFIF